MSFSFETEEQAFELVNLISVGQSDAIGKYLTDVLVSACKKKFINVVKHLISERRVSVSVNDNFVFNEACKNGWIDIIKILLNDPTVDISGYAINYASANGHIEIVKMLLADSRIDAVISLSNSISCASENGHIEIVKLLLADKRSNPASNRNAAIQYSSKRGHIEIVKLLLANERVNPCDDDNLAIKWAAEYDHIEIVKLLIPYTDMSKITDKKILHIYKKLSISEENVADKFNQLMQKNNIKGVFIDDQGKTIMIKNGTMTSYSAK